MKTLKRILRWTLAGLLVLIAGIISPIGYLSLGEIGDVVDKVAGNDE